MRIAGIAAAALLAGAAGFAVYVRVAGDDPARWHVDPLAGPFPSSPNFVLASPEPVAGVPEDRWLASPSFPVAGTDLLEALDEIAMGQGRVERLAGGAGEGRITYVQRSALMAFPDYITVAAVATGEGQSAPVVLSRSRYGYGDLGVNRKRVEDWLGLLRARLGEGSAAD